VRQDGLEKIRARKKLNHSLEGLLPGIYLPLYAMVTFTRMPYADAEQRARFQDRIVYGSLLLAIVLILLLLAFAGKGHYLFR
jgi:kynurenine 3-monooxygenase